MLSGLGVSFFAAVLFKGAAGANAGGGATGIVAIGAGGGASKGAGGGVGATGFISTTGNGEGGADSGGGVRTLGAEVGAGAGASAIISF